jgi:cell division septal protein FtsQ
MKKKKGKKLFFMGVGITLIVFIGGLERGTGLLLASYLDLDKIEVHGCQRTDPQQILKAAAVPPETPILKLDLREISQRVEAIEWVRSCEVRRVLPDKIALRVVERNPVVLIHLDKLYYVDEDGTPFKEPSAGESLDYPILTGWKDQEWKRGEKKDLVSEALWFIREVRNYPHLYQEGVSEINFSEIGDLTIFMAQGGVMIHMRRGDMELKVRRLEEVWEKTVARHLPVQYILYEFPDRIVVGLEERG